VHAVNIVFDALSPGSALGSRNAAVLEASSSSKSTQKRLDRPPAVRKRRSPVCRTCYSGAVAKTTYHQSRRFILMSAIRMLRTGLCSNDLQVTKPYTPAAAAGRQHSGQQINSALEPLTLEQLAAFGATQTDESGSLPPPTPPQRQRRETAGRPTATGPAAQDACTQLTDTELPSFDAEVTCTWVNQPHYQRPTLHFLHRMATSDHCLHVGVPCARRLP
jgi:hypothetical protein